MQSEDHIRNTPFTESLWTVLPAADSTITVWSFQRAAVKIPCMWGMCVCVWVSVCVCVCVCVGGGGGGGGCPVLSMLENNNAWVHRDYVCLLVKEVDWVVSVHNIFCRFVISLQIFTNGSKLIPLLVHIIYWITETLILIHKLLLTDNLKIISLFIRSCQSNMFQYYFYMCTIW